MVFNLFQASEDNIITVSSARKQIQQLLLICSETTLGASLETFGICHTVARVEVLAGLEFTRMIGLHQFLTL